MSDMQNSVIWFTTVLQAVPPMMLGAVLVLTIVMIKGEICPGQRGRIHKVLPVIAAGWLLSGLLYPYMLLPALMLLYYYSRVRKGKARESGAISFLITLDALAAGGLIFQLVQTESLLAATALLILSLLLGAALAHLLLIVAKVRLQAFHRLLPAIGIVSAMLLSICMVPYAYGLSEHQLTSVMNPVLFSFALLVMSILVWIWHIVRSTVPTRQQLGMTLILVLASGAGFLRLFTV